jgi:SAM-dependent methyltransferase
LGERVDFSANAPVYDRRHGAVLASDVASALASAGALKPGARVLDMGAGTGRVAIAFARLGFDVVALEPSLSMLGALRSKAPEQRIQLIAGEGARLPFTEGGFDGVVLARILYLMSDWQAVLQQARDALKPGAHLFHEWGNGHPDETWVQIRERARALFQSAGIESPFHPGARAEADVDACLMDLGFVRSTELPLGPGTSMTLRDFVGRIVSGELSYIWSVPKEVQQRSLPQLKDWCEQMFDLDQPFPMPRDVRWTIYRKDAA